MKIEIGFLRLTFWLAASPKTREREKKLLLFLSLSLVSDKAARRNVRPKKPVSVTKNSILLECSMKSEGL